LKDKPTHLYGNR
jgi:hypothetical protein